jgi:hypothetical protein
LQSNGTFAYRQCWSTGPTCEDFDATQVYNNQIYIYVKNGDVGVEIAGGHCRGKKKSYTLQQFQNMGEDPGTRMIVGWPTTNDLIASATAVLDKTQ